MFMEKSFSQKEKPPPPKRRGLVKEFILGYEIFVKYFYLYESFYKA